MTSTTTLAKDLISVCEKTLNDYECSIPPIKGIRNLSRSDLETAILYAQTIARCGNRLREELMAPRGELKLLLIKFKLL